MANDYPISPSNADSRQISALRDKPVQLAIETTGTSGSIAILQSAKVLIERQLPNEQRTASCLAPAVDEAIKWCGDQNLALDFVSVATGPGSFTGLRIGVTTAKTLCYATKLPLVAVDSVAAIAATVFASESDVDEVTVGINAFRRQVFTGVFLRAYLLGNTDVAFDLGSSGVSVVDDSQWQLTLQDVQQKNKWCAGDAKVFQSIESPKFVGRSKPDAVGVGLLGLRAAQSGQWCDPLKLLPRYLKKSAAEENLA